MIFIHSGLSVCRPEKGSRRSQTKLSLINDKFIVAQNVQNNKQMDSPLPPPIQVAHYFLRQYEVEELEPMTTASPIVQAKCKVS